MNDQLEQHKSFYKYMTASTSEIVLKNRTLRWSHPSEFDDALDVAKVCDEKMDSVKHKQTHDAIIDLIADFPSDYKINGTNEKVQVLVSLFSLFDNDKSLVISELKKYPIDISKRIADLNQRWKGLRNYLRILCLGIEKDNHRLWNDYAEKHRGVVIEFACREESDSPWRVAKPVEYVNENDLFLTVKDWAEILIFEGEKSAHCLFEKCTLRKAKDNKHKWFEQNEWRIPSFCGHHETGTVSDYGVNTNDFSAVYFGYKMNSETQENLLSLLVGELSHVSAFKYEIDNSKKCLSKR